MSMVGESVDFINPLTNIRHNLIIQEYEPEDIPTDQFLDDDYDFPTHCIAMTYTINPDLDDNSFLFVIAAMGVNHGKTH